MEDEQTALLETACESAMERSDVRLHIVGFVRVGPVGGAVELPLTLSVSGWKLRRWRLIAGWSVRYLMGAGIAGIAGLVFGIAVGIRD